MAKYLLILVATGMILAACSSDSAKTDADTVVPDGDTVVTCERDGVTYQVGDMIEVDCNTCQCDEYGSFMCTLFLCDDDDLLADGEANDDDAVVADVPFESYFGEGYDNSSPEKMAKFVTVDELFVYQPAFDAVTKEYLADYYIFYVGLAGRISEASCYDAWVEVINYEAENNTMGIVVGTNPKTNCNCNSTFSVPYLVVLFSKSLFPSTPTVTYNNIVRVHTDCWD